MVDEFIHMLVGRRKLIMKEEKKFQKIKSACIAIFLLVLVPVFLHYCRDFLFFGNVVSILSICVMLFIIITKKTDKKAKFFGYIILLMFSISFSNDFYSYKKIVSIFPILKKVPSGIMWLIVSGFILLSVFIGFFYNYYFSNTDEELQSEISESRNKQIFTNTTDDDDENDDNNNDNNNNDNNDNNVDDDNIVVKISNIPNQDFNGTKNVSNSNRRVDKLLQAISFVATILIIVVVISGIIYMFSKNEYILSNIYNQELIYSISQSLLLIGISIFALSIIIIMIIYFFRICYKIIYEMFTCNEKSYLKDDLFLKCFSIFISIAIYLFSKEASATDLLDLSDNIVIKLLLNTLIIALIAMASLIIYKLLQSLLEERGVLRECAESIEEAIVDTIKGMIDGILNLVKIVPDIPGELQKLVKKLWKELQFILLENDEEEDIL